MQENMSPAPWYIEEFNDFIVVFDDNYEVVCHIDYNHRLERGKDRENAMANARAITASPKMISFLRELSDEIKNPCSLTFVKLESINKRLNEILYEVTEAQE